jgi:hypothetical protein
MGSDEICPRTSAFDRCNVVIETPMNAGPIRYGVDKVSGAVSLGPS